MDRAWLRLVGAATAVYGFAVAARPDLLAVPSGLARRGEPVPPETATCLRPLAWRDAACGLAMALAPDDSSLRAATLLRIAADIGDAALLGSALPNRRNRAMAVTVSLGWGSLSVAGLLRTGRRYAPYPRPFQQWARPRARIRAFASPA